MCSLALLKPWDQSARQKKKKKALQISQQVTCHGKVTLSLAFSIAVLRVNLRCQEKTGGKLFPLSPLGGLVGRTQYRIKAVPEIEER